MALEKTWRWFGPKDPITLAEIKQTGATGIVTALHHIPIGEIWPVDEIQKRKKLIEANGFTWSVAESVPVHEDIKKEKGNYNRFVENYKQSITNLGRSGIDTICYNFMPVLDWSRTKLDVEFRDGSITTKFENTVFAAFDIFILKRPDAQMDYPEKKVSEARIYFDKMNIDQKKKLEETILLGLPGSLEAYSLEEFKAALQEYKEIGDKKLRQNLYSFMNEIIPVAEDSGVRMALHPDDPPWPLLGLPRIVSSQDDIDKILNVFDSPVNGITFCSGSFGAGINNNLNDMVQRFAHRINFIHLRNLTRNSDGDFMEDYHLEGDLDVYSMMRTLILEQKRRIREGRTDTRMPIRPDHGNLMIPKQSKKGIYPGYSLFGRMRGLAELRGLELGIERSLDL
jgi:mannonate dehydratase